MSENLYMIEDELRQLGKYNLIWKLIASLELGIIIWLLYF